MSLTYAMCCCPDLGSVTLLVRPDPIGHQENDTLSDLSDLSWHRHLRRNQTDLINLIKAMYLSRQDPDACHKAIRQHKTLTDHREFGLTPDIIS